MRLVCIPVCAFFALFVVSCNRYDQKNEVGPLRPLNEGIFKPITGARLGPAVEFADASGECICHRLWIENKEVGWISDVFQTKSHLIFFTCDKYDGEPLTPESVLGVSDESAMYELQKNSGSWAFKEVATPRYSFISNPNFCGDLVAYWGSQDNVYFALVYDLNKKILVKEVRLGQFDIATDYSGYFHYPVWDDDCTKVIFPKHNDQPEDLTIELAD